MFQHFSDAARRVVVLAQEEARALSHECIGPEHLLLGLMSETTGLAGVVLAHTQLTRLDLRPDLTDAYPTTSATQNHIPFSPDAKAVMERALLASKDMGAHEVDTEHLLLPLLAGNSRVVSLLDAHDISTATLAHQLAAVIPPPRTAPPAEPSRSTTASTPAQIQLAANDLSVACQVADCSFTWTQTTLVLDLASLTRLVEHTCPQPG